MTCRDCQRDANDNPVAYYAVTPSLDRPDWQVWICWLCLSPEEKAARDQIMKDPRRFKIEKTIKETTP